jgi:Predicted transcriptional regulators
MSDLKQIIARNIATLRKESRMTQVELAEKTNYTDKAVSKWERGESLPDIEVIKTIADQFGVTLDYLVQEEHKEADKPARQHARITNNRIVITCMAVSGVWLVAAILFFFMNMRGFVETWKLFAGAVPASFVILLIFNAIWGKKLFNHIILSFLVWTMLAFAYAMALGSNLVFIFCIGVPLQVLIILWSRIRGKQG